MSDANLVSLEVGAGLQQASGEFSSPGRLQTNILADRERAVLNRLCRKLPRWITPDHLTAIGSVGAAIASIGYIASNLRPEFLFLASLGVAINWFGDLLDGSLARHRAITRPRYGYFLDHSVDAINNLVLALGLGLCPYVSLDAALFLLCSYYLLSIQVFLTAQVNRKFNLTYLYVGPTELRVLAVAFNFVIYFVGPVDIPILASKISLYSVMVAFEATAFVAVFIVEAFATAQKLKREDKRAPMAAPRSILSD